MNVDDNVNVELENMDDKAAESRESLVRLKWRATGLTTIKVAKVLVSPRLFHRF